MSRDGRLGTADTDVNLPGDPKVNALWRRLRRKTAMCEARTIYEDVRLASWRTGERVTVEDAVSVWLDPDPKTLAAMVEVGLLDDEHRIPERAWANWHEPAALRHGIAVAKGMVGGLMRSGLTREQAEAEAARRTLKGPLSHPRRTRKAPAKGGSTRLDPSIPSVTEPSVPDQTDRTTSARDGLPNLDPDSQAILEELTGAPITTASQRVLTATDQLLERHGPVECAAAWRAAAEAVGGRPTYPQVIYGAAKALDPIPDAKSAGRELDTEKRRARTVAETEARRVEWERLGWTPKDDHMEAGHVVH